MSITKNMKFTIKCGDKEIVLGEKKIKTYPFKVINEALEIIERKAAICKLALFKGDMAVLEEQVAQIHCLVLLIRFFEERYFEGKE